MASMSRPSALTGRTQPERTPSVARLYEGRAGRWAAGLAPILLAFGPGCSNEEIHLTSRIDHAVSIEVRGPKADLRGGCEKDFRTRFCADQYEVIGVVEMSPFEDRILATSDPVTQAQCTNVLWLRLVRLDEVGPVNDQGTLILLPTDAEIELGAGAIHSVAFPQATVRIDEVGGLDENQGPPPPACPRTR